MSGNTQPRVPLGGFDATTAGIGSIVGAGAFVAFSPAAAAAGPALALSLGIAAFVALLCAMSTFQLSRAVSRRLPEDRGGDATARTAARILLGPYSGFFSGFTLLWGLLLSTAVLALAFGAYIVPEHPVAGAVGAVVLMSAVNLAGVSRGNWATRFILAFVFAVLAFTVVVLFNEAPNQPVRVGAEIEPSAAGMLQGAGLLFFLFSGYTKLATLGKGVRNPSRNLPLAIPAAIAVSFALYLLMGQSLLAYYGAAALAAEPAPLLEPLQSVGANVGTGALVLAAAAAALGGIWVLLESAGRTAAAMAADRDLPSLFGRSRPGRAGSDIPWAAEISGAAVVIVLVLIGDLDGLIGMASFALLFYAAITTVCAFMLKDRSRYAPRALNVAGTAGALLLALALPPLSISLMLIILVAGLVVRLSFRRPRSTKPDPTL
ncbi:APC family permease [Arthrobacter zhangbolii]|uniref:APC family permease n=1 Tax=Arthrobacter zhangbolii TaxID=2886936 RepID=A0A9X1M6B3_9MICC|nr:APC family permease [Arthrobacter zhangbolii]MCC3271357.1 APC family permease [Arthrobacter zhangbolii]UON90861.1 APC family permease [Arthrobacter zhangbolii]